MERLFGRESKDQYKCDANEKIILGFIGTERCSGTTTLAVSFARYLAENRNLKIAIVEMGVGNIYDSIGADRRFAGRDFFKFYEAVENNHIIKGKSNMDEGINYIIRSPSEKNIELAYEKKIRLITQAKGDIIICDFSGAEKDDISMLCMMDNKIIVIDPLPSKMLSGYDKLCQIRTVDINTQNNIYVINKHNRGINVRQMNEFLKIRNPITIYHLPPEYFYRAEYNCKIPFNISEICNGFQQPFEKLAQSIEI